MSGAAIEPFHLAIPQSELDDLARRLSDTRWPERETVNDWSQGAPLERVKALCAYWRDSYAWRRCEAMLNDFGQHRTMIDGLSARAFARTERTANGHDARLAGLYH